MLLDIEICHVYLREFLATGALADEDCETILRAKRAAADHLAASSANRVRFSVMVDDEEGEVAHPSHLDDIAAAIARHGITPDKLLYETVLGRYAEELIASLRPNVVMHDRDLAFLNVATEDRLLWAEENLRETKTVKRLFLESVLDTTTEMPAAQAEGRHRSKFWVPLRERGAGGFIYSCPLLTAVWYLHRLGVEGFVDHPAERPDALLNILPLKYLKTEGVALDIINLSAATRIRKARKRIDFVFL